VTASIILTPEQEDVVSLREGSYLVLAPPGAGKTEVIAQRIVRLLRDSGGESYRILALTYNNRAAALMRNRVRERLGDESWRATIETYHAFYLDVLRHYGTLVDVPPEVTVYDTVDARIQALAQGLEEDGFVLSGEEFDRAGAVALLDQISRLQRALVPVEAAVADEVVGDIRVRDAYAAYDGVLRRNGAVDFDGMLSRAYELLSEHAQVARHYRRIYRFILVDEAQDTSTIQFELLRVLCGEEHRNVFMVADPDQLINRWLGADRRNLERFKSDFGAREFHLSTNFRCADAVVRVANLLLTSSGEELARKVSPAGNAAGWVGAYSFPTEDAEADGIVGWAVGLQESGLRADWVAKSESPTIRPEDIAILARSRLQLESVLEALEARSVRYSFRAGESGPFDTDFFGATLELLKVLANPRDVAMRRTLLARFVSTVDADGLEPEAVYDSAAPAFLSLVARVADDEFASLLVDLAGVSDIGGTMDRLLQPTPEEEQDTDLGERLRADRELLAQRWGGYKHSVESRQWTWSAVVAALVDEPRDEMSGLRVSTVHGAKGLEFRAVAIVGMNEGSFPDFRSVGTSDEEASERRLAYVAVTRAARALLLSRPRTRVTRYGTSRPQTESRFVQEMKLMMEAR
jgi:DNA helicase-2/ATP-dependent DNA helicase PcrA